VADRKNFTASPGTGLKSGPASGWSKGWAGTPTRNLMTRSSRPIRSSYRAAMMFALLVVLAVLRARAQQPPPLVDGVDAIGMTVSDMDRAVTFYSTVLTFEKVSDAEVAGENFEHLEGVFGLRMRVVRMRLGDEFVELTEYLAPKGRPIPVDSRS